jgi:hypothetical protein
MLPGYMMTDTSTAHVLLHTQVARPEADVIIIQSRVLEQQKRVGFQQQVQSSVCCALLSESACKARRAQDRLGVVLIWL